MDPGIGTNGAAPKRSKYDGSQPHGVKPLEIKRILDYDRGLVRLELRFNSLNGEYKAMEEKYQATADISDRAKLLKDKSSKERQIHDLLKVKSELIKLRPEIEEKERAAQEATTFEGFSF